MYWTQGVNKTSTILSLLEFTVSWGQTDIRKKEFTNKCIDCDKFGQRTLDCFQFLESVQCDSQRLRVLAS